MGRSFRRLAKQVGDRKGGPDIRQYVAFPARIYNIEVMLYELNCYLLSIISTMPQDELDAGDKQYLEATVDFQRHMEGVLKHNGTPKS